MKKIRSNSKPTFFWQGLLIILPVAVLAVVSFASLRQDEQAAEKDARNRAVANVQSLARVIAGKVDDEIKQFLVRQNVWSIDLHNASEPSTVWNNRAAGIVLPFNNKTGVKNWEEKHPGLKLADAAFPGGAILTNGTRLEPPDFPIAPVPPKWFRELSPEQLNLWQAARQSELATNNSHAIEKAYELFLETNPSPDAKLAAEYAIWQAQHSPRTLAPTIQAPTPSSESESGISFRAIVCYRALQMATNEPLSRPLLDLLWRQVIEKPSFVAPTLLDLAEGCTNRADAVARDQVRWMRELWEKESVVRDWMTSLNQNSFPVKNQWVAWVNSESGQALALLMQTRFLNHERGRGDGFTVQFLSPLFLEYTFATALAENKFLVPDYAIATVELGGEPLPSSRKISGKENSFMGEAMQKLESALGASFTVRFYLTSREKLLASERRRSRLFSWLILGTVLTASIGLVMARRAFNQQLHLGEMKSNFVSSVSHELRAPIASVRLLAESLERGKITEPRKQKEYFKFIVQECRRLSSLIENVLDFSRIEQGRKQYEFEPTDIVKLVQETAKLMEPYAAERNVNLALQLEDAGRARHSVRAEDIDKLTDGARGATRPTTLGTTTVFQPTLDGRAIQQALVNLIDNAIKHSPNNATVTIGLNVLPTSCRQTVASETSDNVLLASNKRSELPAGCWQHVRIYVEDSGPGIPAHEHEKIFERFYRLGSELRRETQGIGIGLSIVQHIAEAHGGKVVVQSEVGNGSRFTLELPTNEQRKDAKLPRRKDENI
ncbi:MAG: HAMP domain-containing sensor histidine kinase [Verrucomicrobiota bacterium]